MKPAVFILLFLLAICSTTRAQTGVIDTHPTATIFIIDAQSGQEISAQSDSAILFKDAVIDLVNNTVVVQKLYRHVIGHLAYVITQTDPSNGNEYQVVQTTKFFGATSPVYTFIYNVDQNKLYYDNNQGGEQNPVLQWISLNNMANLDRCQQFGRFNDLSSPQNNTQQPLADNNTPVDTAVTVNIAPPALPVYEQPECPQEGYLWQPGYWAYSMDSRVYYWVPGVWVAPPSAELLWTPAYWAFDGLLFIYHGGYWSNNVGYYGGINYGYGYGGRGYYGGEWREGRFRYNTAVVRVSTHVHNTYINNTVVIVNTTRNNSSFNGKGGVIAKPTAEELQVMHQKHITSTNDQIRNQRIARADKSQFATAGNTGKPMNLSAQRVPAQVENVNTHQTPAVSNATYPKPVVNGVSNASNVNQKPAMGIPAGSGTAIPAPNTLRQGTAQPAGSRGGMYPSNSIKPKPQAQAPEKTNKVPKNDKPDKKRGN